MSDNPNSFPGSLRLQKRYEFQRVMNGGRKYARRFVVAYAMPSEIPGQATRLGITASKRIGDSHVRNRARRRLREIFRTLQRDIRPGYDLALNTRVAITRASFEDLRQDVIDCLRHLDLLSTGEDSGDSPSAPSTKPSASP